MIAEQINIRDLKEVFKKVFGCNIGVGTKREDIINWDSLTHLNLVLELEDKFNISLSIQEIKEINSVESIIKIINEKQ